jgi:hypothetical protein
MKTFLTLLSLSALFPTLASAGCIHSATEIPEFLDETLAALREHSGKGKITCIEDLGATADAPQYVITVDTSLRMAHLKRTGGGWSKGVDYGATMVSIETDNRGFVPATFVRSVDSSGQTTDELNLKINGARGQARVRMDDGKSSRYVKLSFRCE